MTSVRDHFELECPCCGSDECLQVELTCMTDLSADGTETFGDHHWDGDSHMCCANCGHRGTVTDFELDPDEVNIAAPSRTVPRPCNAAVYIIRPLSINSQGGMPLIFNL